MLSLQKPVETQTFQTDIFQNKFTLWHIKLFLLCLKRNVSQTYESSNCRNFFSKCVYYWNSLLPWMFFIPCDNWKTYFIQIYRYPEVFYNHHAVVFFVFLISVNKKGQTKTKVLKFSQQFFLLYFFYYIHFVWMFYNFLTKWNFLKLKTFLNACFFIKSYY